MGFITGQNHLFAEHLIIAVSFGKGHLHPPFKVRRTITRGFHQGFQLNTIHKMLRGYIVHNAGIAHEKF